MTEKTPKNKKRALSLKQNQKENPTTIKEAAEIKKIKIKVVGIGGGGGNIVSEIAQKTKAKISFLVADTDFKALKNLPKNVEKLNFGENVTRHFGTGTDVELGFNAAKSEKEKIKKTLFGQDLIIFIVTLGGGVGSGAGPFFAQLARNLGILTYGIFTLPFPFEGKRKMEIAKSSLSEFRKVINSFSVIPNEKIFKIIDKKAPIKKAFSSLNKFLSFNLQNLVEIIVKPSLINIDFADLKTVFWGHNLLTYLNSLEIKETDDVKEIEKIIYSPLYPYSLEGARGVLLNISGPTNLSLGQVNTISKAIAEKVNKEAKIIFGISYSDSNKIVTTILATGCAKIPEEISNDIQKEKQSTIKKKRIKVKTEKKEKEKQVNEIERKNGLQLKKEIEKEEARILEQEKIWETPPFLRKKLAT